MIPAAPACSAKYTLSEKKHEPRSTKAIFPATSAGLTSASQASLGSAGANTPVID